MSGTYEGYCSTCAFWRGDYNLCARDELEAMSDDTCDYGERYTECDYGDYLYDRLKEEEVGNA